MTLYDRQQGASKLKPRRRPRQGQKKVLSRKKIIETAILMARANGAEIPSMHKIAKELGAGSMSLYYYVTDREDLIMGMLDFVAESLEFPPPKSDPYDELSCIFTTFYVGFCRDEWVIHHLIAHHQGSSHIVPIAERCFIALEKIGCFSTDAINTFNLILHYSYGEVLVQRTRSRTPVKHNPEDYADFPTTMRVITTAEPIQKRDAFERNLEFILQALKSRRQET